MKLKGIMMENKRSEAGVNIRKALEYLDSVSNAHSEATHLLNAVAEDEKVSIDDRNRAKFALKLLNDLDALAYNNVIDVVGSMDKLNSMKNVVLKTDIIEKKIIDQAIKVTKHSIPSEFILTAKEEKDFESEDYEGYTLDDVPEGIRTSVHTYLL